MITGRPTSAAKSTRRRRPRNARLWTIRRDRHPTCAMMVTPGSALRHRLTPDMGGQRMVLRKTHHEIQHMAAAGRMLAAVHEVLRATVRAGVTTAELDDLAETEIRARGGTPS